jgi:hypothetical protein
VILVVVGSSPISHPKISGPDSSLSHNELAGPWFLPVRVQAGWPGFGFDRTDVLRGKAMVAAGAKGSEADRLGRRSAHRQGYEDSRGTVHGV